MWIITERRLREAMEHHPDAQVPLTDWIVRTRTARFSHFHQLRAVFGSADVAYGYTIFDIGGNKYRLITDVDYAMGRVYVRAFLTHAEYDHWNRTMRRKR